jgi:hypothetical protein
MILKKISIRAGRSNTSISLPASSINSRCAIKCPALAASIGQATKTKLVFSIPDAAGLPLS